MGAVQDSTVSRIILSNVLPNGPYELGEGYTLRSVRPLPQIFEAYHRKIPLQHEALLALPYFDQSSYNVWRDLVMFHSFISDFPATYEHAELAQRRDFENSELTFVDYPSNPPLDSRRYPRTIDFDRFDVAAWDPNDILPKKEPELSEAEIEVLRSQGMVWSNIEPAILRHVEYRRAFHAFTALKSARKRLYNQIRLFVFTRSIWSIMEVYRNDYASVAFYMAILEPIAGRPSKCSEQFECSKCKRRLPPHDVVSLEEHFIGRFGGEFSGLRQMRHKFSHSADWLKIAEGLFEVWDQRLIAGEIKEEDLKREEELHDLSDEIERLAIMTRKILVEMFLDHYQKSFGV